MTRKTRRAVLIGTSLSVLALAVALVLFALRDSIVFFYSPSEVAEKQLIAGQRFRLGGLVEQGSVKRGEGTTVRFTISDQRKTLPVTYTGILPDLFREGQGVIAEGSLQSDGVFQADSVLAKHDETYMPPEVAMKLKEQGVWRGDAQAATPEGSRE
jgi:cytochrome c-type biogenesis protein CcmE